VDQERPQLYFRLRFASGSGFGNLETTAHNSRRLFEAIIRMHGEFGFNILRQSVVEMRNSSLREKTEVRGRNSDSID